MPAAWAAWAVEVTEADSCDKAAAYDTTTATFAWLERAPLAAVNCSLTSLDSASGRLFHVGLYDRPSIKLKTVVLSVDWRKKKLLTAGHW